jgi:hypothetical protein
VLDVFPPPGGEVVNDDDVVVACQRVRKVGTDEPSPAGDDVAHEEFTLSAGLGLSEWGWETVCPLVSTACQPLGQRIVQLNRHLLRRIQVREVLPLRHHLVDPPPMSDTQFRHLPCGDHPHRRNRRVPRVPHPSAFLRQVIRPALHLLVERVFACEAGRDQVRHHEFLVAGVDGHVPVAGRDEDELPCLRGDGDDIAEIAPLEEVERLPGDYLVELGVADARGAERVVVPFGLDVLPTHGPRRDDSDVEPGVLLTEIRTVPGSEGEVAVHVVQGYVAGLIGVREHAPHIAEGPDGRFREDTGPVAVHLSIFCCGR